MRKRARLFTFLALIIITPLGFASKFYTGVYFNWINNSLGGILYVIFWCLVIFLFFPKLSSYFIAILVFLATSLLELTQLLSYPVLENFRSYFLGRTLIGTSFTFSDFPYYFIGAIIGILILEFIKKISKKTLMKT